MSSQKQKHIAERDTLLHEELSNINLYKEVKDLLNTVSHDNIEQVKVEGNTLKDIRLNLLMEQKIPEFPETDLDVVSFLSSEFFDVFSFIRCWHPYRKAPIEQHNLFHIPTHSPQGTNSDLFWKIEPDTVSSLDFLLFMMAPSEISDQGAKLVDLIIALLKTVYKRRSIDITNWETHLKQWLHHLNAHGYSNIPNESPFSKTPHPNIEKLKKELHQFQEYQPQQHFQPQQFHAQHQHQLQMQQHMQHQLHLQQQQQYQQYMQMQARPMHPVAPGQRPHMTPQPVAPGQQRPQPVAAQQQMNPAVQPRPQPVAQRPQPVQQQPASQPRPQPVAPGSQPLAVAQQQMNPQVHLMAQQPQQANQEQVANKRNASPPPANKKQKLLSFSFFSCQLHLRSLILSLLIDNGFQTNFDSYKSASDKYHAEYMRFEPLWTPPISSHESCGSVYQLYDECLWYRSHEDKWYLLAYTSEQYKQLLELKCIKEHPTLYQIVEKHFSSLEEELLDHQDIIASAHTLLNDVCDTPLFRTHRQFQLALFLIHDDYQQHLNQHQMQIKRQHDQMQQQVRVQEKAALVIEQELKDLEHQFLKQCHGYAQKNDPKTWPHLYKQQPIDLIKCDFIKIETLSEVFNDALKSIFYLFS